MRAVRIITSYKNTDKTTPPAGCQSTGSIAILLVSYQKQLHVYANQNPCLDDQCMHAYGQGCFWEVDGLSPYFVIYSKLFVSLCGCTASTGWPRLTKNDVGSFIFWKMRGILHDLRMSNNAITAKTRMRFETNISVYM
jgi:hypothetical protein